MDIGQLRVPEPAIEDLCQKWQVQELAVFGSVLREDFTPRSDVDLLVTFAPGAPWTLLDLVTIRDDFAHLLNRPVDLVERSTIVQSPNWIRRREILGSARTIYAAR